MTRLGARALCGALGLLLWVAGPPAAVQAQRRTPTGDRQGGEVDGRPAIRVPGTVRVGIADAHGYTVRELPLEEYVAGVLTGEAARDSDPAVLQALAVAIRTYALRNLSRHQADGFDVCDQTHCQVLRRPTPATTAAADRTAGRVLTWRGALALVYYSASCGGHTQVPSAVWTGAEDPPYLPSRPDDGCGGDPVWSVQVAGADIERTLRNAGYTGTLKRLRVQARDRSGRVTRVGLDGMRPSSIPGPDLRMALGPTQVKSTAFEVHAEGDAYAFFGHGYGHGVGMCVIGATRLASRGESAEALLARYYPGTVLGTVQTDAASVAVGAAPPAPPPSGSASRSAPAGRAVPAPSRAEAGTGAARPTTAPAAGTSLDLPDPASAPVSPDRGELDALIAAARSQLATRLGAPAPQNLSLVVHADDRAFERATGRHWFTFGAVAGPTIHLMPLEQLRQRGVLERVIRREVAHAIVDAPLRERPQWVRDGVALYFADPDAGDAEPRGPCPADVELLDPVSAGALAQAYAAARRCAARQIARGRSWRDVK